MRVYTLDDPKEIVYEANHTVKVGANARAYVRSWYLWFPDPISLLKQIYDPKELSGISVRVEGKGNDIITSPDNLNDVLLQIGKLEDNNRNVENHFNNLIISSAFNNAVLNNSRIPDEYHAAPQFIIPPMGGHWAYPSSVINVKGYDNSRVKNALEKILSATVTRSNREMSDVSVLNSVSVTGYNPSDIWHKREEAVTEFGRSANLEEFSGEVIRDLRVIANFDPDERIRSESASILRKFVQGKYT